MGPKEVHKNFAKEFPDEVYRQKFYGFGDGEADAGEFEEYLD